MTVGMLLLNLCRTNHHLKISRPFFLWKIDWQEYRFRLSRTKLKSNCVSRQWAICTSDRSGVLWLDGLGLDTCQGEGMIKEAPSYMADTWMENESATHERYVSVIHEQQTSARGNRKWMRSMNGRYECDAGCRVRRMNDEWMRSCDAWTINEYDAWIVNECDAWMISASMHRRRREVWYVHVPPC